MEYVNTVERLMDLLVKRDATLHLYTVRTALDRLIEAQVDRVKVNVMTHILEGMDYFNGKAK